MDLRVTLQTQINRQGSYLRKQTDALARLQEQASSGLRVNKPSDDPIATGQLMRLRSEDGRRGANEDNANSVRSRLDRANSELLEVNSVFTRARQLALEAANDGTDSSAFETMAGEVDRLLDRTLALANSQADGRALFGGTSTQQDPFTVTTTDAAGRPATIAYQGADVRASVTVGRNQQVDMLYSGESVFQKPGKDTFGALIGLRDLLRNVGGLTSNQQRQAISGQLGALEQAQGAILDATGEISASLESLEGIASRLGDQRLQGQTDISSLESADIAQLVVQLTAQQTLLSSTLAVTAKSFDQNLLDLLR